MVQGAEIPPPFGGKYRQVMVYVDPYKLVSRQLSPMDVVDAVNNSNLILPAGDVKVGPFDYYMYSNSLVRRVDELNSVPIKTVGQRSVTVGDIGQAKDAQPDPVQHSSRGRPAIGLYADHEAGRRHQHHRGGQRHPRHDPEIVRRPETTGNQCGFRPVGVRERGNSDRCCTKG